MLWIDFINSDARDHRGHGHDKDHLTNPVWIKDLTDKWNLRPIQIRSPSQLAALQKLRALIQRWVSAIVDREPIAEADINALNRHLGAQPVRTRVKQTDGSFHLDLVPTAKGIGSLVFAVAASFADFLVQEDPTRLKLCANPDCLWVFYDTTRSRTRRWCAVGCGDLIKVREFRQRQKRKSKPVKSRSSNVEGKGS